MKIIPQPKWNYFFTCKFCGSHIPSMGIGKKAGDIVRINTPSGEKVFKIMSIS